MLKRNQLLLPVASLLLAISTTAALAPGQTLDSPASVFQSGFDAYIYGYPLLMFAMTERAAITVPTAGAKLAAAPLNQFGKELRLPDSSFTDVVLPSTTTLYASSFLNLKPEPVILHIPNFGTRFFLLQMLDAWTNVSEKSPGTRLGSKEGDYALVGPGSRDSIPPGIPRDHIIKMNTNSMWIIGRIYTSGTEEDIDIVKNDLYPELTLTPASQYGTNYTPPSDLPIDPSIDTATTPLHQVAGMDACSFFGTFASMMEYNKPLRGDGPIVKQLAEIGIFPGKPFDCTTLRPNQTAKLATLQLAVAAARKRLDIPQLLPKPQTNFWLMPLDVGTYGQEYLLRAEVAHQAFGANNPIDAVYGYGTLDGRGIPLNGGNQYTIHFKPKTSSENAEEIPPVNSKAFWSVTIYNQDGTLVANDMVKYNAIGIPQVQGHDACLNSDKSLDLYLQPNEPSGAQFCNWLPIPDGQKFIVFLRMYWPDDAVRSGKWVPPPIQRIR